MTADPMPPVTQTSEPERPPDAEPPATGVSPAAGPTPTEGSARERLRRIATPRAIVLAVAFVASRAGYHLMGVRYDASLVPVALQNLETNDLHDRLLQSLWYQHTQPPLFNLFIGLVLKFSPVGSDRAFQLIWLALGVALVALVYRLLLALHVQPWFAVAATIVITCSPTVVLYENWMSYEYPLTVAIVALTLAAIRWMTTGRLRWLAAVAVLCGACVLTRALLNPIWYVGIIAVLLVARRPTRRWLPALAIALAPLALVAAVVVKNQVVFGEPTLSSWVGWNIQRVTIDELPTETRDRLIADGTLTPMAAYPVFLPVDKYAAVAAPCTPAHPDVPVLAEPTKHNGIDNFNQECFLPITREALRNALAAARAEPRSTARAVVGSFEIWGESSSQYAFVYDNRLKIDAIDTPYRQLVLVDIPWDPPVHVNAGWWIPIGTPGGRWRFSLTIVLATAIGLVAGARSAWRLLRRRGTAIDVGLTVIGFTILTVTLAGNLLEIGENNRFRFMVEPITLIALAWFLDRVARRIASRRRARTTPPPEPIRH